jgi:MerR family transcriptional regulator, copper efflux regulator
MKLINVISKEAGLPIHTIRYYENYGLFKGKKNGNGSAHYSYYDDEILEKLELIKEAKEIGFTLAEIKTLLDAWHSKRISIEKKREILREKIKEIDAKIRSLKAMKKLVTECMKDENL